MKKDQTVVYVPPGAKINEETKPLDAPKVKYEKRKSRFNIDATKKVIGGKYGRTARLDNS